MKLTKLKLKQIIKEELEKVLKEVEDQRFFARMLNRGGEVIIISGLQKDFPSAEEFAATALKNYPGYAKDGVKVVDRPGGEPIYSSPGNKIP